MKSRSPRNAGNAGHRPRRSISWLLASAAAIPALVPSAVRADATWDPSIPSGNWNTPSNWLGNTLPNNTDNIYIAFNDSLTTHNITFNGTISSTGNLFLGNTSTGAPTFIIPPGFDFNVFNEAIGNTSGSLSNQATGIMNQTGATNSPFNLFLGFNPFSTGVYNLSGATSVLSSVAENVGYTSIGTFNHTDGVNNAVRLVLGQAVGGVGVYNLSNTGNLSGSQKETIGVSGWGTLHQTGGTNTIGSLLLLGTTSTGTGGYTLNGSAAVLAVNGSAYVGGSDLAGAGTGILNAQNGTMIITGTLKIWDTGTSTVNLSGGILSVGTLNTSGNPSRFTSGWTGGTFAVTGPAGLTMDSSGPFGNSLALNSARVLAVTSNEFVGNTANGTVNQTGGLNTVGTTLSPQNLHLGFSSGATGAYTLSGASSLTVNGSTYLGGQTSTLGGSGLFNMQGGSANITGTLKIWDTPGTAFNLTGGLLRVGTLDTTGNPSRFNWTTGTLSVSGAGGFAIGSTAPLGSALTLNSNRTLNVDNTLTNNGTLTLNGGTYQIGSLVNNGTLNYQNSSTITGSVTNAGIVSGLDGALGSLAMSTLRLNSGGTLKFDLAAPGNSDELIVSTTGGLNLAGATTINLIDLGALAAGTYTLIDYTGALGGSLGNLSVGSAPAGFNYSLQNDGTNTAINLIVSDITTTAIWVGGTGNWSNTGKWNTGIVPNNSALHVLIDNNNAVASAATLDQNATVGDVTLDAGESLSINATRTLTLAGPAVSTFSGTLNNAGTLAITGGALQLNGGGSYSGAFNIAAGTSLNFGGGTHNFTAFNISGPGTMNLTTGTLHVSAANPTLAGPAASSAQVSMTGGTWNSDSIEIFGDNGAATFSQSGGLHTNNGMILGNSAAGSGVYLLSGGTLTSTSRQFIGPVGSGTFILNGPAVANLTSIFIGGTDVAGGGSGIVNISNGAMNASGTLKVWDTGSSAVNFSGGLLSAGTLNTSGNPSRFNWSAGTLAVTGAGGLAIDPAGPLGSSLTLNSNRALNVTNTLTNNGTLTLNGGSYQIGGLLNNGTLNYQNTVAIAGNVTNAGTISGFDGLLGSLSVNNLLLSSGILKFDLAAPTSSDEILVLTSNGLNLAGPTTINLANIGGLAAGTYTLFDYSGTFAGLLSNLSVTTAPPNFNYALQNNSASTTIELVVTAQQAGTPGIWLGGNGNWSDTSKWTNGTVPNDSSFHVQIDSANAAVSIVALNQNATVADVTLDSDDTLNINATRTLTLTGPNTSTFSGILNNAGTLALTGSAILNNNGTHSGAFALGASTLDLHAGTHTFSSTSSFSGTGTVAFTGATVNAQHLILGQAATDNLTLNQSAGNATIGTLGLGNNGTLTGGSGTAHATLSGGTLTATSILLGSSTGGTAKLTITGNAHVETNSLAIAPAGTTFAGTLDLTDRPLIVHAGNISNLAALVKSGYNAGTWNGSGINSSVAAANANQGLGLITGADYLLLHSDPTFNGTTVVPADVLMRNTWQGDADLDGYITMNDYSLIEAGFLFGNFNGTSSIAPWDHGDFNYDGVVNYQDYALIDAAFHAQSGTLANDEIAAHSAEFGAPYLLSLQALTSVAVPEPASLALLLLAAPALLRRRKRLI